MGNKQIKNTNQRFVSLFIEIFDFKNYKKHLLNYIQELDSKGIAISEIEIHTDDKFFQMKKETYNLKEQKLLCDIFMEISTESIAPNLKIIIKNRSKFTKDKSFIMTIDDSDEIKKNILNILKQKHNLNKLTMLKEDHFLYELMQSKDFENTEFFLYLNYLNRKFVKFPEHNIHYTKKRYIWIQSLDTHNPTKHYIFEYDPSQPFMYQNERHEFLKYLFGNLTDFLLANKSQKYKLTDGHISIYISRDFIHNLILHITNLL